MLLTPRIAEAVDIPVITCGGIADGRSLAAAIVLGADGVMMATRFIASNECIAHPDTKEHLVQRQEHETTMICKSVQLQMRVLKNEQARKVLEVEANGGGLDEIIPLMAGEHAMDAWETGDVERAPLAVGQSIGLIHEVLSCQEVIDQMVRDAEETLSQARQRILGA
jgi:nitronate monooxygenase